MWPLWLIIDKYVAAGFQWLLEFCSPGWSSCQSNKLELSTAAETRLQWTQAVFDIFLCWADKKLVSEHGLIFLSTSYACLFFLSSLQRLQLCFIQFMKPLMLAFLENVGCWQKWVDVRRNWTFCKLAVAWPWQKPWFTRQKNQKRENGGDAYFCCFTRAEKFSKRSSFWAVGLVRF